MVDLLGAALGRRTCPWCRPLRSAEWPLERFMAKLTARGWLFGYDAWVGRVGCRIHGRHES